jgi:hypothetical protein
MNSSPPQDLKALKPGLSGACLLTTHGNVVFFLIVPRIRMLIEAAKKRMNHRGSNSALPSHSGYGEVFRGTEATDDQGKDRSLPEEEADQVANLFRPTLSNLSIFAKRFLRRRIPSRKPLIASRELHGLRLNTRAFRISKGKEKMQAASTCAIITNVLYEPIPLAWQISIGSRGRIDASDEPPPPLPAAFFPGRLMDP